MTGDFDLCSDDDQVTEANYFQMLHIQPLPSLQHGWKQQRVPCRVERLPARGVRGQER